MTLMHEILRNEVLAAVNASSESIRELALKIYNEPELSGQEHHARQACVEILAKAGFLVSDVPGVPTAFDATLVGASVGPTIGLFAEYDALPGVGHGCGHHLIAGATVGAALGLASLREDLPGSIRVFGCPAEETLTGKRAMIRAGAFDGVDAALSFHSYEATTVMKRSTGNRELRFSFTGRPSHAASEPWLGASALDGVLLMMHNVNALRQFVRDGVRMHGIITDGGKAHNVIPDQASCTYGIRSSDHAELQRVVERVIACAEAAALASGTELRVEYGAMAEPVSINPELAECVRSNLQKLGETVTEWDALSSTDFGDVSQLMPSALFSVATWPAGTAFHTHEAATLSGGEQALAAMLQGARAMALTSVDIAMGRVSTINHNQMEELR